jgi:hypothetical protein
VLFRSTKDEAQALVVGNVNDVDIIEGTSVPAYQGMKKLELEALNTAKVMEIEDAEAVLRVEFGSKVNTLTSSELKRDLLIYAKRNPVLFLELAHDENVQLRNIGVKATEARIIKLSPDQRTFTFGDTDRKLMTVPFDEHPYSALAAYFKTDEGMEVYKNIIKRLN